MRKRARPQAFLLIMVLFLLVILVTMGFGLLGSQVGQYQSTVQAELSVRARALARAGLEDARTKLNRDINFPPPPGANENLFSYSEDFYDVTNTTYLGSYRVTVDTSSAVVSLSGTGDPYYAITSVGATGQQGAAPLATHSYRIYLDNNPAAASYFQIIRFDDLGSPNWDLPSGGPP